VGLGFLSFGHAEPDQVALWVVSKAVVPDPRPGVWPGAVDVPQWSAKLDASTVLVEDRLEAIHSDVSAARLELPGHIRFLGEQGQASLDHAVEHLTLKGQAGHLVVVREIAQNTRLTSELLKRTADLHAQAASIEQNQAFSLAQVERVTSSLPDQLSRLELKLDDLSREAFVLKSLSLESSSTIELTSKAVRHLLKGKGQLVKRSAQKPETLALEGPSLVSDWDPTVEGPRKSIVA
jgi:hypothetical protein